MESDKLNLYRKLNRTEEITRRQAADIDDLNGVIQTQATMLERTEEILNITRRALLTLESQISPQVPPDEALRHVRHQILIIANRCRPLAPHHRNGSGQS